MVVLRMLLDVILLPWLMTSVPRDASSLLIAMPCLELGFHSSSPSSKRNTFVHHTRSVTSTGMGTAVTLCPSRDPPCLAEHDCGVQKHGHLKPSALQNFAKLLDFLPKLELSTLAGQTCEKAGQCDQHPEGKSELKWD